MVQRPSPGLITTTVSLEPFAATGPGAAKFHRSQSHAPPVSMANTTKIATRRDMRAIVLRILHYDESQAQSLGGRHKNERCVRSTKAERIGQHRRNVPLPCFVRHEIDLGRDRWIVEIDRWRNDLVADGEDGKNG